MDLGPAIESFIVEAEDFAGNAGREPPDARDHAR